MSMTENGDPRENVIAERVNGILKDEWLNQMKLSSIEDAIKELKRIVQIYNSCRPHASFGYENTEICSLPIRCIQKHWKTYYKAE
ncbi:MAG: transposase [Paludibacter sp.]|nr:transposase [Paludibacter sp.]